MKNRKQLITLIFALAAGCCTSIMAPSTPANAQAAFPNLSNIFGFIKDIGSSSELTGVISASSYTRPDDRSLNITWDTIAEADGYEVTLTHNGTSTTYESTQPSITIDGLTPASVYTYQIRYYKNPESKIYSAYSVSFTALTSVKKVTGLKVTELKANESQANVVLSWDVQGDASYQIYYKKKTDTDFVYAGETSSNTYTIDGLECTKDYVIRVRAFFTSTDYTGEFSDNLQVVTCPAMISGLKVTSATTNQLDISWNANTEAPYYYVYRSVNGSEYTLYTTTASNSLSDTGLNAGTVYSYKVCAWYEAANLFGPQAELRCVTNPYQVTGLTITGNTSNSITMNWDLQSSATGYLVYRRDSTTTAWALIGSTLETAYIDTTVASGKTYRYRVRAYADTESHVGEYSATVKISSLPAQPAVKPKAGYGKLRLSWKAVTGAAGYYIYQQEEDGSFTLINTLEGKSSTSIVYNDLVVGNSYYYKVYAYRSALDQTFVSEDPDMITVIPLPTMKTTSGAYLFKTKAKVIKSAAWKVAVATKAVNYKKSFIIPGLTSTNVAGFASTNMCPQAMCFAGKYILITAYDRDKEENSVIYVLNKSNKKLKTVIVLENKTHAGGMCYDGSDVWITYGSKLSSIPYSAINKAARSNAIYSEIKFTNNCKLKSKGSFATYYNDLIWVGSYNASGNGVLYSYSISESGSGKVSLKSVNSMTIPSAVQGITFTSDGKLLISRAYSYIHQLDIYKPKKSGKKGKMKLNSRLKVVSLPYLSQGIDISGKFLYVNFESAVSPQSIDHIDRVLAFKLKPLLKVPKKPKKAKK